VIVNDISALRNKKMLRIVSRYKAAVIIMHMKGMPSNMQKNPVYKSLIEEIVEYLDTSIKQATQAGVDKNKIIIDPGIGFGKTLKHNLEILKRLNEFKVLGKPILVGVSRKSFLGKILNAKPQERLLGTVSACISAVRSGAHIVRVHDVREVSQALKINDAVLNC
jgi:dihydropteroate synthase